MLAWFKNPALKYEVLVRNRVNFVTTILPFDRWSYVKSSENPADLAMRGISIQALTDNQLWLHGPSWLNHDRQPIIEIDIPENLLEVQRACVMLTTCKETKYNETIIGLYLSYDKLIRIVVKLLKTFALRTRSHDSTAEVTTQQAKYLI